MISNLRSRPIQGYVTDSAGNVIRNSNIVIARSGPDGMVTVDRVDSDDEGYFISSPLPNGTYDIFESGIKTSSIIHGPDQNSIQCFKASTDNYYPNDVRPFSTLVAAQTLNSYKYFLQIEPEDLSVDIFGNMFPIYDLSLNDITSGTLYNTKTFFNFNADSRLTISRFDIEYFLPLTATQASYRRIKWAGVPGIKFKKDSKIVVPLDYYSIVANNPFKISNNGEDFGAGQVSVKTIAFSIMTIKGLNTNDEYIDIYNNTGIGDIVKLTILGKKWYGILLSKTADVTYSNMVLEKWMSSRFASEDLTVSDNILTINTYHGMFQGMTSMSATVSEYFNVVENIYQQTMDVDLYNYSGTAVNTITYDGAPWIS